jgi:site-specific DNA-methyltransferase (adenine-specific)
MEGRLNQGKHRAERVRLPLNSVLLGDAAKRLRELPPMSVDCIITSPPYFGLRNYGQDGQLGLEPSVEAWVAALRAVFAEAARVLKPTGSLWLNVGDGYSAHPREGAPHKSLLLGPTRLALALVADGWVVRNQVIWAKPNPMPSSVSDRLSCTYEIVYFLVRSRYYYFDLDAIRVPHRTTRPPSTTVERAYPPREALPPKVSEQNQGLARTRAAGRAGHPLGKNPGDVWTLPTAGFRGAHFATFPPSLVERPLLATCPVRVCGRCGRGWRRQRVRREPALGELRPTCACRASPVPGLVLDPFIGSGTVAIVAEQHGRNWLGIELSPRYAAMAEERIRALRRPEPTAHGPPAA